jgi:hypothetical protein
MSLIARADQVPGLRKPPVCVVARREAAEALSFQCNYFPARRQLRGSIIIQITYGS